MCKISGSKCYAKIIKKTLAENEIWGKDKRKRVCVYIYIHKDMMTFSSNLYASLWCDRNTRCSSKADLLPCKSETWNEVIHSGFLMQTIIEGSWGRYSSLRYTSMSIIYIYIIITSHCVYEEYDSILWKTSSVLAMGSKHIKTYQNIFQNWPQMHLISLTLVMCVFLRRGLRYIDTASEAPLGCMRRLWIGSPQASLSQTIHFLSLSNNPNFTHLYDSRYIIIYKLYKYTLSSCWLGEGATHPSRVLSSRKGFTKRLSHCESQGNNCTLAVPSSLSCSSL